MPLAARRGAHLVRDARLDALARPRAEQIRGGRDGARLQQRRARRGQPRGEVAQALGRCQCRVLPPRRALRASAAAAARTRARRARAHGGAGGAGGAGPCLLLG